MGKILEFIKSRLRGESVLPETETEPIDEPSEPEHSDPVALHEIARALTPIVVHAGGALMLAFAGILIFRLFNEYLHADGYQAGFAVAASVGVVLIMFLANHESDNCAVLSLSQALYFGWLAITLVLVALYAAYGVAELKVMVPPIMTSMGGFVAIILSSIALAAVLTLWLAARGKLGEYKSTDAARHAYFGFVKKVIVIGVSMFGSLFYGIETLHINPVLAVLCALVLEICFIFSYTGLNKAKNELDRLNGVVHSGAEVVFGTFIGLVVINSISSIAKIDVPILEPLREAGKGLFVSSVGLAMIYLVVHHVLNGMREIRASDPVINAAYRPLSRRIADKIRGARLGFVEIFGAVRGELPALPAGEQRTIMAKDAPLDISEEEFIDAGEKTGILSKQQAAVLRAKVVRKDAEVQEDAGPK